MRALLNLVASGLVALVVSAAMAPAADLPAETHASKGDRVAALAKRVDALQNRLADTRAIAQQARSEADTAVSATSCITGGIWMSEDPDTADWWNGDGTEPDAALVATLDASCAGAAS